MDGCFVPNLTFGHPVVKCLRAKVKEAFFDVHMMVEKPEQWVSAMKDAGADQYIFQVEASEDPAKLCAQVRREGMKVGVALKPGTPVEATDAYVDQADTVLIMTVEPGFGGQKFMPDMMSKVRYLREKHPLLNIEVDGGVGPANIDVCAEAGANMIVSGTAVVYADDPSTVMRQMRDSVKRQVESRANGE